MDQIKYNRNKHKIKQKMKINIRYIKMNKMNYENRIRIGMHIGIILK